MPKPHAPTKKTQTESRYVMNRIINKGHTDKTALYTMKVLEAEIPSSTWVLVRLHQSILVKVRTHTAPKRSSECRPVATTVHHMQIQTSAYRFARHACKIVLWIPASEVWRGSIDFNIHTRRRWLSLSWSSEVESVLNYCWFIDSY